MPAGGEGVWDNPICQIKSVRPDILLVLSHICELAKKQIDKKGQVICL
jgi:hypothetical protein